MNLSIYCGLRAIGWIADDGEKVVNHGIKRLDVPFDHYYEFINGFALGAFASLVIRRIRIWLSLV